jgi:hypothetical protein
MLPKRGGGGGGGFVIREASSDRSLEEVRSVSIFYLTENSNEGHFRERLTTQHAEVPANIMIL